AMVMRTSAAAAASRAEAARRAPAATSESARAEVRFHTTRGKPAFNRLCPMGRPIRPRPIRPTVGCCGKDASGTRQELDEKRGRIVTRAVRGKKSRTRRFKPLRVGDGGEAAKNRRKRARRWLAA